MTVSGPFTTVEEVCESHLLTLEGPLQTVCRYALRGGRGVRAGLLFAAAPGAGSAGVHAAAALELMHTATLLQDDIFDAAHLRRGQTAVHIQFGKALAILASDWLLLTALEVAAETSPVYFGSLSRAGKAMAQAEASELAAEPPASYAEAERLGAAIARGKTGRLFGAALCGAATLHGMGGPACVAWEALGTEIGVTYQMVDDCLDVYACERSCGKDVRHDLAAGCPTLPMLLGTLRLQRPAMGNEGRVSSGDRPAKASEDLLEAVQTGAVREELREILGRRLREHQAEAQRLGLAGTAWERWIEELRERVNGCLDAQEEETEPRRPAALQGAMLPGV